MYLLAQVIRCFPLKSGNPLERLNVTVKQHANARVKLASYQSLVPLGDIVEPPFLLPSFVH